VSRPDRAVDGSYALGQPNRKLQGLGLNLGPALFPPTASGHCVSAPDPAIAG
jgi:hypothetical protein